MDDRLTFDFISIRPRSDSWCGKQSAISNAMNCLHRAFFEDKSLLGNVGVTFPHWFNEGKQQDEMLVVSSRELLEKIVANNWLWGLSPTAHVSGPESAEFSKFATFRRARPWTSKTVTTKSKRLAARRAARENVAIDSPEYQAYLADSLQNLQKSRPKIDDNEGGYISLNLFSSSTQKPYVLTVSGQVLSSFVENDALFSCYGLSKHGVAAVPIY